MINYIMIQTSFFIIFILLLSLLLFRNNIIEGLGPPVMGSSETDKTVDENKDEYVFLTNNKIDYDRIDNTIDNLTRQYESLKYDIDNLTFSLGYIDTLPNIDASSNIMIGGSYPRNIKMNFQFPKPLPGGIGEPGPKGNKGEKGKNGPQGERGLQGGPTICSRN